MSQPHLKEALSQVEARCPHSVTRYYLKLKMKRSRASRQQTYVWVVLVCGPHRQVRDEEKQSKSAEISSQRRTDSLQEHPLRSAQFRAPIILNLKQQLLYNSLRFEFGWLCSALLCCRLSFPPALFLCLDTLILTLHLSWEIWNIQVVPCSLFTEDISSIMARSTIAIWTLSSSFRANQPIC